MNGINGRNDIVYKATCSDKVSLAECHKIIRYNYKLDIFHKVLSNMVRYTSTHPHFTIEKNLEMLNYIENCILDNNFYLKQKNSYDQKFILDVYQSETEYLNFLTKYYSIREDKDYDFIQKNYYEGNISFDISDNNELMNEFPLLKPILFVHDYFSFNREYFIEDNKKFIKENYKK